MPGLLFAAPLIPFSSGIVWFMGARGARINACASACFRANLIARVCSQLSYNVRRFTRVLKRETGLSPERYRGKYPNAVGSPPADDR